MALGELSREAIQRAIQEYDSLGRDGFLEKYGFGRASGYALEYEGRSYDPKAIAGVAYGLDHPDEGVPGSSEFSGGMATNRALQRAGFNVVQRTDPDRRVLRDLLEEFLATYFEATKEPFSGSHPAQELMRKLSEAFAASYPVAERATVTVRGSTGQGNWARAPWIAFLDSRETTTTQTGVYPVLLFREDMSGAYMALAQGTTALAREHGRDHMRKVLAATAAQVRPLVEPEMLHLGFSTDDEIELGTHNLARNYEDSTIVHKLYLAQAVPGDSEVTADLDAVLDLFDRYFQQRGDRRSLPEPPEPADEGGPVGDLIRLLKDHHNIVLEGVPGTGKSHSVEKLAAAWQAATGRPLQTFGGQTFAATVMHPSTSYEDFIEGLRPTVPSTEDVTRRFDEPAHGDGTFKVDDGFFLKACIAAVRNPDRDVLVLLDELNRCNIPSVLGDLLLTLESSKRAIYGPEGPNGDWIAPVSVTLPYSGRSFFVPNNVYVVATTNTTDRSVAPMDAAIRRRFAFVRLAPEFDDVGAQLDDLVGTTASLARATVEHLSQLNERVLGPCLGPDALLGHSYCYLMLSRLATCETDAQVRDAVVALWRFTILPQLIDTVRTFGAEDLLTVETRDRWFADHGAETDGGTRGAQTALEAFDAWVAELNLTVLVEGTGLSRGARVHLKHAGTESGALDIASLAEVDIDLHAPVGNPETAR